MEELTLIQKLAVWALPVIFAITLHEAGHAWAANKLGDPTAKMLGRVTLNPLKHIDPIGTVILPAVLLAIGGFIFGWAKAVPVTTENFKKPASDMAWVAIAGPFANFLMVIFWAIVLKVGLMLELQGNESARFLIFTGTAGISINLILMLVNMLPIPPLDGSRIVAAFMPKKMAWQFYRIEPYGIFILLGLILLGFLGPIIMAPYTAFLDSIYTLVQP